MGQGIQIVCSCILYIFPKSLGKLFLTSIEIILFCTERLSKFKEEKATKLFCAYWGADN